MGRRAPRAREDAARHVFAQMPPVSFLRFPRAPASVNVCSRNSLTTEMLRVGALTHA